MAVSDVASVLATLQSFGFSGKFQADGTLGFNLASLATDELSKLLAFRRSYGHPIALKRSGTGLRVSFTPGVEPVNQQAVNLEFTKIIEQEKRLSPTGQGYNVHTLNDPEFVALVDYQNYKDKPVTLKRSGTGLRVTVGN
jgi:hypothetical protein